MTPFEEWATVVRRKAKLWPLLALAGCAEPSGIATAPSINLAVTTNQGAIRPGERHFADLAAVEPSFGGYFYEDDSLVVLTTDVTRAASVRSLTADLEGVDVAAVVVRQARFTFEQLRTWRDRASDIVWTFEGVRALDLDEARGRVTVYVGAEVSTGTIRDILERADVPRDAVEFEFIGRIIAGVARDHRTLNHLGIRPVTGGHVIHQIIAPNDFFGSCTYGFSAMRGSDPIFLTNSHCTQYIFSPDGTLTEQGINDQIGYEFLDPPSLGCFPYPCRNSDAAASMSTVHADSFAVGRIARTEYRTYGPTEGSKVIDDQNPYFEIVGKDHWPAHGEVMNKVGRSTGWTYGPVHSTCTDLYVTRGYTPYWPNTFKIECASRVAMLFGSGDSGSPVFKWQPGSTTVILQGMAMSYEEGCCFSWFSPLGGIEQDLGNLVVTAPPLPSLTVGIFGPIFIDTAGQYSWQANASGGSGSYTYLWEFRSNGGAWTPVSSQQTYQTMVSSSDNPGFDLRVTVASGALNGSDTHAVTVQIGACQPCE